MSYFIFFVTSILLLNLLQETGAHEQPDWWQSSIIYQIYPLSFKDSNGDGYGDLSGIFEKLDYIKDIGVDVIWIQSFYKSPMKDLGYDVSDLKSINSLFGTMEDFKKLLEAIHARGEAKSWLFGMGMKLLLDFVPNHSSDQCEWFKLSLQGVHPYKDYYIYKDAKKVNDTHSTYPNNWRSVFGGAGWTWREERKQYSFNQFSSNQPEFDLRNPQLLQEMQGVLKYWSDLGVDGFRIDAPKFLIEAAHFEDEPKIPDAVGPNDYFLLNHTFTVHQPENYELVKSWRAFFEDYKKENGQSRILGTEDYDWPINLKNYLGNDTHPGAQIPFYMRWTKQTYTWDSAGFEEDIRNMMESFPKESYNWVLDNHDELRVSTRFNPESVDSMNILALLLPGTASIYYGSELGLEDIRPRPDQRQDPQNYPRDKTKTRDASRGPMLWDGTRNAGFTTAKRPWLPVSPNYYRKNVKTQQENPNSHLNIFKRIVRLRKTPVIQMGDFESYVHSKWVYMFTRSLANEIIVVIMNLGSETEDVCAKTSAPKLPNTMFVHTSSIHSGLHAGEKVNTLGLDGTGCVSLRPFATVVLATSHGVFVSNSISILLLTVCLKFMQ